MRACLHARMREHGLSNTTWFGGFAADLRQIRPLLAESRLLLAKSRLLAFTLVPGVPGVPVYSLYSRYSRKVNPAWKPNRITLFWPKGQK